jgi:flagellar protein FliS
MFRGVNVQDLYNKIEILTADPLKLIIMMYEGAIQALKDYKIYLQRNDYIAKESHLNKAQDIITELLASLNMEAGEIARLLAGIYSYVMKRLVQGDLKKDIKAIDEVIWILSELKEGWEGLTLKKGHPPTISAPMNSFHSRTRTIQV